MKLTGAEIMVRVLAEEGVTTVFGYPGGAILPFYDALRESSVRHILTAHEQGAAHAADGFARASGKVGVCVATSGPGATNLITGLATAYLDSIPVIAITGQVQRAMIGHDAFQEVDITGISMPITKHNFLVKKPESLARVMRLAFQIAKEGRPGPVLIDVPRDVQTAVVEYTPDKLNELAPLLPAKEQVEAAVAAISKAERPVMLVGGGVINADAEYDAMHLCEKLHIPVVSTLMGLGAISAYRKLFLGMTGLHGHERANNAVKEADLILAVGTRFNDRVTGDRQSYSADKIIIHLDIDPAELDKNINSSIGIVGNMNRTLNLLEQGTRARDLSAWWDRIASWPDDSEDFGDEEAPRFFAAMNPVIKGKDYIITTDVGQHQMWAAQHLKIEYARQFITSGGLGTMGFGLPAAMGASFAKPGSKVISMSGDGGFKMTGSELFTISSNRLPITAIVFNNVGLGMIRQLQTVQFDRRFTACEMPGYMDFVKYAEAFGIKGEHVSTPEDLAAALERTMEMDEPYLIEVAVNPKDMVLPMVAPGLGINDYVKLDRENR